MVMSTKLSAMRLMNTKFFTDKRQNLFLLDLLRCP